MNINTVNISFQKDLLKQIDKVAKEEARTRSELIREAARLYIEKKRRWEQIFAFGDLQVKNASYAENELDALVHNYRNQKRV
jgi:CopG family transcriptional regulator / antitoxin EndoAI